MVKYHRQPTRWNYLPKDQKSEFSTLSTLHINKCPRSGTIVQFRVSFLVLGCLLNREVHKYQKITEQMFEQNIDFYPMKQYYMFRDFEHVFLQLGGSRMDYKKLIIELVNKSNNIEMLELVYRFCKKLLGQGNPSLF